MFIPKIPCTITKVGGMSKFGQELEGTSYAEMCHTVRLRRDQAHTTVRTDSSATVGHADEDRADVIVLLTAATKAVKGDKLTVDFIAIRITSMHPRRTVMGRLDHFEVKGELWE